jgi:hypothetical protein
MRLHLLLPVIAALLAAAPATAATRSFTITGFERIRVDGPYQVKLTTNVAPFARASGSQAALDALSVAVEGRTLVIRSSASGWSSSPSRSHGKVEISLGTHELASAFVNGSGSLDISEVRGLAFEFSLQGSGRVRIGRVAVDRLKALVSGTGTGELTGKAELGSFYVRGSSNLDASGLAVKAATIGLDGTSSLKLTVIDTAKVDAQGPSIVQLSGRPACTVRAQGSAEVSGCR